MLIGVKYRLNEFRLRAEYALDGGFQHVKLRRLSSRKLSSLSIVMVGRNDDYMPDFADRLRITIDWNLRHVADEAILVEWNPPPDRELLGTSLVKIFPRLKVFVVPAHLHEKVCHNPRLPLMEYHAKNVGIRRAKTDLVVATNADVAMAADTALALRNIEGNGSLAWAAERIDIPWKEWRKKGIGVMDGIRYRRIIPYEAHGTGDFLMASRELWHRVRGYDENLLKHRIGCDVRGAAQMKAHGAEIRKIGKILHLTHPTSCTEGVQPHHGEYAPMDDLPYTNSPDWGLGNCREIQIAERVWQLELPT